MPLESADLAGVMAGATHVGNPQSAIRNRRMGEARDGVRKNANICRA